jgi:hypothetical protein
MAKFIARLVATASGINGNSIYYGADTTWYTGTNSGTVNTVGTTVYWASGKAFQMKDGDWDGGSITINGTAYTIAKVKSPYALILTASAGNQTGVAYSNSLFVRPIFDGGGATDNLLDVGPGVGYVTISGIEFTGDLMACNGCSAVAIEGSSVGRIFIALPQAGRLML